MQSATWKVGLLVVVFAGLAYGVYVLLGARLTGENVYRVYADFENIGGLTKGAKVMMAGVDVGTVEAIELVSAHRARATLAIRRGVRIPEGTTARLPGAMFLPADQKVDLIPPTEIVGFLEPGQVLMGTLGGRSKAFCQKVGGRWLPCRRLSKRSKRWWRTRSTSFA